MHLEQKMKIEHILKNIHNLLVKVVYLEIQMIQIKWHLDNLQIYH